MSTSASRSNEPLIHHWMPFTGNKQFQEAPRIITRAKGIHYWNTQGEQLIDGVSGLYTTPAGHGRPRYAMRSPGNWRNSITRLPSSSACPAPLSWRRNSPNYSHLASTAYSLRARARKRSKPR